MTRRLALLLALGALALGCRGGPSASTTVEVVIWHAYRGAEQDALAAAVSRFEATHADLHVRLVSIPYDAFVNKISVAIPRGNGPDLFIFAHDRVGDWAARRLVEPIGFWADEALIDRFLPTTIDPLLYRGDLYGLPMGFKTLALYYDTLLVEAPPATTDALIATAKALRQRDPAIWGLGYELDSLYFHAPWLHGFGGRVYADEDDTLALGEPAAAASAAFVRRLVADEHIVPDSVTSALVTTLFHEHKLAFVVSGPWFRSELDGHSSWAVAPLPVVSETGLPASPFLGVEGLLLSAYSAHKREAFTVMTWLTADDEALHRWREGAQLVANRAVYDEPDVKSDAFAAAFRAQVEHTVSLSNRPHMKTVWTPVKTALSQVITQGRDAREAFAEAVRTIERAGQ